MSTLEGTVHDNVFLLGCKDPEGAGQAIDRAKEIFQGISEKSNARVRFEITIFQENDVIPITSQNRSMQALQKSISEGHYAAENAMRK